MLKYLYGKIAIHITIQHWEFKILCQLKKLKQL
jgi:hypothetical protein